MSFYILLFFFNATATSEIYTLSLHDALPICEALGLRWDDVHLPERVLYIRYTLSAVDNNHLVLTDPKTRSSKGWVGEDRKSTRLNSSHLGISYAVFCLKKKKTKKNTKTKLHT